MNLESGLFLGKTKFGRALGFAICDGIDPCLRASRLTLGVSGLSADAFDFMV